MIFRLFKIFHSPGVFIRIEIRIKRICLNFPALGERFSVGYLADVLMFCGAGFLKAEACRYSLSSSSAPLLLILNMIQCSRRCSC